MPSKVQILAGPPFKHINDTNSSNQAWYTQHMLAPLLSKGDHVRVIAPARSLNMPWMGADLKELAQKRLEELGLTVSFGKYVNEFDAFDSTTIKHRVQDLHDAFADQTINLVLTVIGGYNSNQLLNHIDYDLIKNNPKRLCGFSDITALGTAIYAKTGLVTYSGPHFFNFGQKKYFDYTLESFVRCHFHAEPYDVLPSSESVDGYWALAQDNPKVQPNAGWTIIHEGGASGTIIGGNLCTLSLLQGTQFMPKPDGDVVLFLEDDEGSDPKTFDRMLQSLLHQPIFSNVRGLLIGRFMTASNITHELLGEIIASKEELKNIPIITNVDFGHTTPLITFPIGGTVAMDSNRKAPSIRIIEH